MKRILIAMIVLCLLTSCGTVQTKSEEAEMSDDKIIELIEEAYIYAYPLIMSNATKEFSTNVPQPVPNIGAPINQFVHNDIFPDDTFKHVVRVNVDTFYSAAWLDLETEPLVLSVPKMGERYYLLPMLDAWTNAFVSPGTRTTGNQAGEFLITGPDWQGSVPTDIERINAPTNMVWIVGRTQVNSKADGELVVKLQEGYKLTPLSSWGKNYTEEVFNIDSDTQFLPPKKAVTTMSVDDFFNLANELMIKNSPRDFDADIIERIAVINVGAGKTFDSSEYSDTVKSAVAEMPTKIAARLTDYESPTRNYVNGWYIEKGRGDYGTNYEFRAQTALVAMGAPTDDDALYPKTNVDGDGQHLSGTNKYIIHFEKDQIPDVNAFWSITIYGKDDYLVPNSINRFAIGDRDNLKYNEDGSLDIYIQKEKPELEKEQNWLPAPEDEFLLTLRMYWVKESMLDGNLVIPPVEKQ